MNTDHTFQLIFEFLHLEKNDIMHCLEMVPQIHPYST